MGAWGDGVYDNDKALDELGNLLEVVPGLGDAANLVAQIGLRVWLDPSGLTQMFEALAPHLDTLADELARLPADTFAALAAVRADPDGSTQTGTRTKAVEAALGGYADGPRMDALLRFPGAQPVIDALGERAAELLDGLLSTGTDLYPIAGNLAALGVVLELQRAGLYRVPAARVGFWRAGFPPLRTAGDLASCERRRGACEPRELRHGPRPLLFAVEHSVRWSVQKPDTGAGEVGGVLDGALDLGALDLGDSDSREAAARSVRTR